MEKNIFVGEFKRPSIGNGVSFLVNLAAEDLGVSTLNNQSKRKHTAAYLFFLYKAKASGTSVLPLAEVLIPRD